MSSLPLSSIPTLRALYANATLTAASRVSPLYPPRSPLLDRVSLIQGDITTLEVDAIVNAANESLLGGGGVDGTIHRRAGPGLLKECRTLNGAETGESKMTGGYDLPAKHIIHTVGPIYSANAVETKANQLASCYRNSLDLAVDNSVRSIAFCSISTGIYGYPIYDATRIALKETREYLDSPKGDAIDRLIFVVWSNKDRDVYQELLPQYFPNDPETEN